ncbi:major facilitator superfamily domain-containing protein [Desarmillaria ectypa]|nr:major facilitator superfamily domain-containing protein [Desarmillaria ectypa]
MTLVALGIADVFLRPRASVVPPRKVDRSLLMSKVFLALCSIGLFSGPGFYVPIFHVPDYAVNGLGRNAQDGANAAALISGFSAVGRVLLGIVGDHFGHLHILSLCQSLGGIGQMAIWPFTHSLAGLVTFTSFHGFFTGGYVRLYPVVAADLYGVESLASIAGVMFASFVPGTLIGPPVSVAILDRYTNPITGKITFLPVQLFGGSWLLSSAAKAVMVQVLQRYNESQMKVTGPWGTGWV